MLNSILHLNNYIHLPCIVQMAAFNGHFCGANRPPYGNERPL